MSTETALVVATADAAQPEFLMEMVPAAEETALLFHISYLCLAKFPVLERVIRANAVEVQMAFNSSDNLLLRCIGTSDNMVNILLPRLISAVEKSNALVAVKILEKAKAWIEDIIREVDAMVNKYGILNQSVANATSDVIQVKKQTDNKIASLTQEEQALTDQLKNIEDLIKKKQDEVDKNKKDISDATEELQRTIAEIGSRDKGLGILSSLVPFLGSVVSAIVQSAKSSEDSNRVEGLRIKLEDLQSERAIIAQQLGQLETQKLHLQFDLTKKTFDKEAVPHPGHLEEVQQCLTRIQENLLQLKSFWEKIDVMLRTLKQKTFADEYLVDLLPQFKDEFVESIGIARQAWQQFQNSCSRVRALFALKNRDAYRFLEFSPSALSPQEWQQKYDELKAKLEDYFPSPPAIEGPPAK